MQFNGHGVMVYLEFLKNWIELFVMRIGGLPSQMPLLKFFLGLIFQITILSLSLFMLPRVLACLDRSALRVFGFLTLLSWKPLGIGESVEYNVFGHIRKRKRIILARLGGIQKN